MIYIGEFHPEASTSDYKVFPYREINNGSTSFEFKRDTENEQLFSNNIKDINYMYHGRLKTGSIDELCEETKTTAFMVIKDDTVYIEKYYNGYGELVWSTGLMIILLNIKINTWYV
jgi:hypothetical protein